MKIKWGCFRDMFALKELSLPVDLVNSRIDEALPFESSPLFQPMTLDERRRFSWINSAVVPVLADRFSGQSELQAHYLQYYLSSNSTEVVLNNVVPDYGDAPGQYRKQADILRIVDDFGVYIPPSSKDVSTLMQDWGRIGLDKSSLTLDPFIARYLFYGLIHPQSDLNGRIARLFLNTGMREKGHEPFDFVVDRNIFSNLSEKKRRLTRHFVQLQNVARSRTRLSDGDKQENIALYLKKVMTGSVDLPQSILEIAHEIESLISRKI